MHATKGLMDEHQTILRALAAMERIATDAAFADEPRETFHRFATFLRTYADKLHHCKEEDILFPAMERGGLGRDQGPIAVMLYEHEIGRGLVRRMLEMSAPESEDFSREQFAEPALEFIGLLRAHIAKEDHILYPMAERILPETVLTELGKAYAEAEARDFPPDIHEEWESWAVELATRAGVQQDRYEVAPACG